MAGSENYRKGAKKPYGSEVSCNEFWGLDPNNLPKPGDWVVGPRSAHELTIVRPSPSKPGTVSYRAIKHPPGTKPPPGVQVFSKVSNLKARGY